MRHTRFRAKTPPGAGRSGPEAGFLLSAGGRGTAAEPAPPRERRRAMSRTVCILRGKATMPEGEPHVPAPSRHARHGHG